MVQLPQGKRLAEISAKRFHPVAQMIEQAAGKGRTNLSTPIPEPGRARDKAAERMGVSGWRVGAYRRGSAPPGAGGCLGHRVSL